MLKLFLNRFGFILAPNQANHPIMVYTHNKYCDRSIAVIVSYQVYNSAFSQTILGTGPRLFSPIHIQYFGGQLAPNT